MIDASETVVPKPLKPKFRYPNLRERLTTIIAVDCQDGVILAADGQETHEFASGLRTKELVTKIDQATYGDWRNSHCLLGCAGIPTYVSRLEHFVGEAIHKHQESSYLEALTDATNNFADYVYKLRLGYSEGDHIGHLATAILVGHDTEIHKTLIYTLSPPHAPEPLRKYPHRTGTGSGWVFAGFLFNLAELLMRKLGLTWKNLSTTLAAQFCYIALNKVMNYEGYTGLSTALYRLDQSGKIEGISNIFPLDAEGKNKIRFIMRTFMNEKILPSWTLERLPALMDEYGIPPELIDLFSEK